MHLYFSEVRENLRALLQLWPVKLDVLARRDMRITFVVSAGNISQLTHLSGIECAIWHSYTQHRCIALHINAVLKSQRQKLFFRDLTVQIALHLALELGDALVQQLLIVLIVYVHSDPVALIGIIEIEANFKPKRLI